MIAKNIVLGVVAGVVVVLIGAAVAAFSVSRCVKDFKCLSQFQFDYFTAMNNALWAYGKDTNSCYASQQPEGANFIYLEDLSGPNRECHKMDPENEGFIPRVISASSLQNKPVEKSTGIVTGGQYTNEAFGISFALRDESRRPEIKESLIGGKIGSSLEDLDGSIQRFFLEPGKKFADAIQEIAMVAADSKDKCEVRVTSPDGADESKKITIAIWPRDLETYRQSAEDEMKDSRLEGLDRAYAEDDIVRKRIIGECSRFANGAEKGGGEFIYDPLANLDNFYFIERVSKAGQPSFYDPDTIRILPRKQ